MLHPASSSSRLESGIDPSASRTSEPKQTFGCRVQPSKLGVIQRLKGWWGKFSLSERHCTLDRLSEKTHHIFGPRAETIKASAATIADSIISDPGNKTVAFYRKNPKIFVKMFRSLNRETRASVASKLFSQMNPEDTRQNRGAFVTIMYGSLDTGSKTESDELRSWFYSYLVTIDNFCIDDTLVDQGWVTRSSSGKNRFQKILEGYYNDKQAKPGATTSATEELTRLLKRTVEKFAHPAAVIDNTGIVDPHFEPLDDAPGEKPAAKRVVIDDDGIVDPRFEVVDEFEDIPLD